MHHINKHKAGLALGAIIGGVHIIWSILIALGWAKPLLDFIYHLHMIKIAFVVESFDIGLAFGLIVTTAVIGYIVGYSFAFIWNKIYK